ncbi:reverse transcriptase domain-containing protein [Tanacetum coccineum]
MGIAEDVVVRVDGFTFLADFVMVNLYPDPRVPIILGRPFLRTAKALIDLYEETLTLRVGKEELVYYADKSKKNKDKNFVHAISIENSNEPELLQTPLSNKGECFDPGDDIDEIDAFLAKEISMDYEEGYYDSGGVGDTMIFDFFSPRSDSFHLEFAGGIHYTSFKDDREFRIILNLENVHANQSLIIESLPVSLIPVEDSDPVQEEIDIFLVPDDLIPPGDDSR